MAAPGRLIGTGQMGPLLVTGVPVVSPDPVGVCICMYICIEA